jgi:hypothetical protein
MPTLPTHLRSKLENVVIAARDIAEAGAKQALEALAVQHYEPFSHMPPPQRQLRNHLRARARQLGDQQDRNGRLTLTHLIHECAYEHWHRMLFARFLAENHLLIEPEMGVAITLDECEELAKGTEYDKWTYASRLAQQSLPQIFRPDDPLLQISLAKEHLLELERLLDRLEADTFTASDAIGWVYQFWQSKRKKEVNDSGNKIGADELPAVTQLFTEDYMVDFMLDNTLGAWWTARHQAEPPVYNFKYLRFKDNGTPMAGTFDGWPEKVAALKCLDPCCGSGHFLVALFKRLVPLRMAEESLSRKEAARAVLQDNIYGLEIDARCTQLAAFALALAAWKLDPGAVREPLPSLNIACCGLELGVSYEEWKKLAPAEGFLMKQFYELFSQASTFGSLIDPKKQVQSIGSMTIDKLQAEIETGLLAAKAPFNFETTELSVTAHGLTLAYRLLSDTYHLVATNVPYLARGKQSESLKEFILTHYTAAKQDLATAFVERCLAFCRKGGATTLVTPQNWLFLGSYLKLREKLLKQAQWDWVARLGPGAFETIGGEVVNVALSSLTNAIPANTHQLAGVDASSPRTPEEKARLLGEGEILFVSQEGQLGNPDARVTLEERNTFESLEKYAVGLAGILNGDSPRFLKVFWEIPDKKNFWSFQQTTQEKNIYFGGLHNLVYYDEIEGHLREEQWIRRDRLHNSDQRGQAIVGKNGVAISSMRNLPVALFLGNRFDSNVAAIIPKNSDHLPAIWCFCSSPEFNQEVRKIDQALKVTNASLVKVPFDLEYWQKIAQEKYPNVLPAPYSDDPTQWIFHGRPEKSTAPLQVAVARLLGYRWPAELDEKMRLSDEARALVKSCDALLELTDEDGIVCIPSVRGEEPAAARLRNLLINAHGSQWHDHKESEIIKATGSATQNLDDWLRTDFFEQHCKLFHHRPFVWHLWDGRRRDGFQALVNYHKLAAPNGAGRKLLENLTYSYLNDWIARQKDGVARGEGGADERLIAALELQKRLIAIIKGESPYDIFVRWKPIEQQPIGWEPDINDGVRLNIRPFMVDDIPGGKKGAGILRWKPNINWEKDRGKEPMRDQAHFPWFWENGKFTGNRVNDVHLRIEEKTSPLQRGVPAPPL